MSLKQTFNSITEDDSIYVRYSTNRSINTDVKLISKGENGEKRIVLSLTQDQPTLVYVRGKVRLERRPLGHPRGWKSYVSVDSIEIQ